MEGATKTFRVAFLTPVKKINEFLTNVTLHDNNAEKQVTLVGFLGESAVESLRQKLSTLEVSNVGQRADPTGLGTTWSSVSSMDVGRIVEYLADFSKKTTDSSERKAKDKILESFGLHMIFRSELDGQLIQGFVGDLPDFQDGVKSFAAKILSCAKVYDVVSQVPVKLQEFLLVEWLAAKRDEASVKKLTALGCDVKIDTWLMKGESEVIQMLMKATANRCFINAHPFHCLAYAAKVFPNRIPKLIDSLETIVQNQPPSLTRYLLMTPSRKHYGMSTLQYCCRIHSDEMFENILNNERLMLSIDDAHNYEVTNLTPDCMYNVFEDCLDDVIADGKKSGECNEALKVFEKGESMADNVIDSSTDSRLSCLEIIVASSSTSQSEAAKLLNTMPMSLLVQDYTFIAKMINVFMFLLHVIHVATFTYYNLSGDKMRALDTTLGCLERGININETSTTYSKAAPIRWIVWPLVAFSYSFVQFKSFRSIVNASKFNVSAASFFSSFPYVDCVQLLLTLAWAIIDSFEVCVDGYLRLLAVIFILSWLRPLKYLAFGKHWNAFVVALKSSVLKYIVSFVFVFAFIFLGFSFAIRAAMIERDGSEDAKPLQEVVYVSFISVFGMGDLSDFPTADNTNLVFLRTIISVYCAVAAILILAMLRQPDDDLVARVGLLRSQRVKLELVKEIIWLVSAKRGMFKTNWKKDNLFCSCLFVKKILGFYDFAKEYNAGRFYVRVCKETIDEWKEDKIGGD